MGATFTTKWFSTTGAPITTSRAYESDIVERCYCWHITIIQLLFGGFEGFKSTESHLCYNGVMNISPKSISKLFSKVRIDPITNCWNWIGSTTSNGYGNVRINKKLYRTHRLTYMLFVGDLPIGKGKSIPVLDHLCNNRLCCNPAHLQLISDRENILKGNGITARKYKQIYCKNGHILPNPIRGHRRCMICHRAWNRRNYAKNPMKFILKVRNRRLRGL